MTKKLISLSLAFVYLSIAYPFRLTLTSSIEFDTNYLRLSEDEMSKPIQFIQQYGGSTEVSSLINRNKIALRYFLDDRYKSFFIDASSRYSYYSNNSDKNYFSYSIFFSKKLKSYTFLKGGYRYMPEYYLRNFIDRDFHYYYDSIYPYQGCYFNQESVWISYSLQAMKKTWVEMKIVQQSMLYNDRFNEYDLLINTAQGSVKTKLIKKYFFDVSFSTSLADNTTFQDGQMSTLFVDRGYTETALKASMSKKFNKKRSLIEALGLSTNIYHRKYTSESDLDLLHIDRTHIDSRLKLWMQSSIKDLRYKFSITLRSRATDSPYAWVQDLKSFEKYEAGVEMSYRLF